MSEQKWKPETVAMVDYGFGEELMIRGEADWSGAFSEFSDGSGQLVSVRPLAVIDAEDREQVERLIRASVGASAGCPDALVITGAQIDHMQAALREFAAPTPPRPEEPIAGGSQVREADGTVWTRVEGQPDKPWVYGRSDAAYSSLDVVEVLR